MFYNGRIYLYTGHDEAPTGTEDYVMNDWLCYSSDNLTDWKDHGSPLKAADFKWSSAGAYATKVVFRHTQFYWYVSVKQKDRTNTAIGVVVSDHPAEGFRDAIGAALITHNMLPSKNNTKANLDPSALIDDDGQAYIFWGNKQCYYAKLNDSMIGLDGEIKKVDLPEFEEGAHIHKRNGWYDLSYGFQMWEKVAYAMSRDINGPWEFKGILNELSGNCKTNRPCIIEFKGRNYFIITMAH